jgi:hypothetical protein
MSRGKFTPKACPSPPPQLILFKVVKKMDRCYGISNRSKFSGTDWDTARKRCFSDLQFFYILFLAVVNISELNFCSVSSPTLHVLFSSFQGCGLITGTRYIINGFRSFFLFSKQRSYCIVESVLVRFIFVPLLKFAKIWASVQDVFPKLQHCEGGSFFILKSALRQACRIAIERRVLRAEASEPRCLTSRIT